MSLAAVRVPPAALDAEPVHVNNRDATVEALRAGHDRRPGAEQVLAERDAAWNPYFRAR